MLHNGTPATDPSSAMGALARRCRTLFRVLRHPWGFFFLAGIALYCWPVDVLQIRDAREGTGYFCVPAPLGQGVATGYVHSLQRTPVRDYYSIVGGKLWTWREYVQSHNAGLPYSAPAQGRFLLRSPWMIVEGGRMAVQTLAVRVGTQEMGRNILLLQHKNKYNYIELYKKIPGRLVLFQVERVPLRRLAAHL